MIKTLDAHQSRHIAWNDRDHRRSVRHSIVMRRAIASVVAPIPLAAVLAACSEAVADEMPAAAAPVEPLYFTGSPPEIEMVEMWVRDSPPVTRKRRKRQRRSDLQFQALLPHHRSGTVQPLLRPGQARGRKLAH